ncbi:MAG: class I SAM-dependent methyltransferase [Chlorobi bacterium]|nr:class I SAM-dependent methyltransferase [Chlorobiota bacterium]
MPPPILPNPTARFSNRVCDYVRYRPGYPAEVVTLLQQEYGLTPDAVVADVGSGTGLLTQLFLKNGNVVYGVEPNQEMRLAGEEFLAEYPNFQSIAATAESTQLPERSVDILAAGQAFHWFQQEAAKKEFQRILKPNGIVVLIWNVRRTDATPFLREYEALLAEFGAEYTEVIHRTITNTATDDGARDIQNFFTPEYYRKHIIPDNFQHFDAEGLIGRARSASYMPAPGDPRFNEAIQALQELFNRHQQNGKVRVEYDTELHVGWWGQGRAAKEGRR